MPPRKIKRDADAVRISDEVEEHVYQKLRDMEFRLRDMEIQVAKETSERILSSIPQNLLSMNLMEFMGNPTISLFGGDLDDVAHDTSISLPDSSVPSGRNTATETRHELITPAGHVLEVPSTIHPKLGELPGRPFRRPHLDEEIAFSVNGSPMILGGGVREMQSVSVTIKQKTIVVSNTDKQTAV